MKKLVILGGGESGIGAAILAKKQGYSVFLSDKGQIPAKFLAELNEHQIDFEQGQHSFEQILSATEIIKSPGIPDKLEIVQRAREKNIPVISEIEFAARYAQDAHIIGITGSNGKTTTTHLTYHLLKTAGLDVVECGNVGTSFARYVAQRRHDYYVLELSSFQLDGIQTFRPHIAILLNITPDHLDRYDYEMAKYVSSKFRIVMNQAPADFFIYNGEDVEMHAFMLSRHFRMKKLAIHGEGMSLLSDFDMSKSRLKGAHNYFNAACAIAAAQSVGATVAAIQQGLNTFVNAPHRLEYVATLNGVEYINDSKATNVDSVYWALKAMSKPTHLILGGLDKGNDYKQIEALVRQKVKAIICMGRDNRRIIAYFEPIVGTCVETASAEAAVQAAAKLAQAGEVVLLSPACASFDLFKNYEDRGERFKSAVLNLTKICL